MKKHVPAFLALSVLGLLVVDTAFASGGFRQPAPAPVVEAPRVNAPAPIVQTKQLSEIDLEIKAELERQGKVFPSNWLDWTIDQQDQFLADLDFEDEPVVAPAPVVQPAQTFAPAPVVTNDSLVLDTLRSLGFGIPSTFNKWSDRKKASFLKSLLRPDTRNREVLSKKEADDYKVQQVASQAAQSQRIEAVAAPEFVEVASGSIQANSGKTAAGSVTVQEKGDQVMITLEGDFSISDGPDLFVTLTTEETTGARKLDANKLIKLDALSSTTGTQVYSVSKADFEKYGDNLAIWCQAFNIVFGSTSLR